MDSMESIKKFNTFLEKNISMTVKEGEEFSNIKESYRNSTGLFYSKFHKSIKKDNKYLYFSTIMMICHCYNRLMEESERNLRKLLMPYMT